MKTNRQRITTSAFFFSALVFTGSSSFGCTPDSTPESYAVRLTFGNHVLSATLENNATTRAFIKRLPLTLPMMDLYGREMCYRFPEALPTDNAFSQGYEVGEIVYYPPMHSFVILYAQNGERFQMQKLGRIDSGVEAFDNIGDIDVHFELQSSASVAIETSDRVPLITARGGEITVSGGGLMRASVYSASGSMIASATNRGVVEVDCGGISGPVIIEVQSDESGVIRRKILLN